MHIRQSEIAALEAERELFVVDAKCVQNRRVQIVNMDGLIDDVVTEVVSFAIDLPAFDATACHPHCEVARMMVATVVVFGQRSLTVDRAPKFSAPDHQRIIQHSALFQILYQGSTRPVAGGCHCPDCPGQSPVMVPASQKDLSERYTTFRHPPRQ